MDDMTARDDFGPQNQRIRELEAEVERWRESNEQWRLQAKDSSVDRLRAEAEVERLREERNELESQVERLHDALAAEWEDACTNTVRQIIEHFGRFGDWTPGHTVEAFAREKGWL